MPAGVIPILPFIQEPAIRPDAVANSAGLFGYHASSSVVHTCTVRTPDGRGSGWAGTAHNDWGRTTPGATLAARAIGKAQGTRDAAELAPGEYTGEGLPVGATTWIENGVLKRS
jgi:hypothetical protein